MYLMIDLMIDLPGLKSAGARISVRRSMTLCALGASIGLGISAYGLFTAQGTSTRTVPPEDVATVNGRPILRSDFVAQLEMETGKVFAHTTLEEQRRVLDEMIREELLVQRGLELDFAETDQNVRNALATSISDQAVAEVTTAEPTEQQLQQYFAGNRGRWASEGTMTLRHLVLPHVTGRGENESRALASEALAALRNGMTVEQASSTFGLSELDRQDREYYFTIQYRLGDRLFAAVKNLDSGTVSDSIVAPDGIHLIEMIHNEKPVPEAFATARPQVLSDYNNDAQARVMENTLKFLRGRAKIRIAADYPAEQHP